MKSLHEYNAPLHIDLYTEPAVRGSADSPLYTVPQWLDGHQALAALLIGSNASLLPVRCIGSAV